MSEIPFHVTRAGRTYYGHTLPNLVAELQRINASLAALIDAVDKLTSKASRVDSEREGEA